jgi:transcriptional regulator with XRE-family HTH domain
MSRHIMEGSSHIIEALRSARTARGLSQRALAARVGLPQSHISKIESGSVDIQLSSLVELARALGLELQLVPRKAVPAVESIIRQTSAAGARGNQARAREALNRASAIAERLVRYDTTEALESIRDAVRVLQFIPLAPDDLQILQTALQSLRPLERVSLDTNYEDIREILDSPKTRSSIENAARILTAIRNRAVHHPATEEPRTRPAYTLDEEDDNG